MNDLIKPEYETLIFQFRRFPTGFTFELTKNEKDELVANCDRLAALKHSSNNPLASSEQGVAMLSSVLRSENYLNSNEPNNIV